MLPAAPVHPMIFLFSCGTALRQFLVHLFAGFNLFGGRQHVPDGLPLNLLERVLAEPAAGQVEAGNMTLQVGDHHQSGGRFQHCRREGLLALQFEMDSLGGIDVDKGHHRAVNLIVHGPVGPDPHGIPAASQVLDLPLAHTHGVDHLGDQPGQVRHIDVRPEVDEGPPHVAGQQVQQFFGQRGETPDAPVAAQHQDGDVDATEQVGEIVVELRQLEVAVP